MSSRITSTPFGSADGEEATLYTLTNSAGLSASVSTLGATLVRLMLPDKAGKP
jgi:aldose 1-epimerase